MGIAQGSEQTRGAKRGERCARGFVRTWRLWAAVGAVLLGECLIVGLLRPQSGTVWAFERVRARERDFLEVHRRAGLVFQNPDDQLSCPTGLEDVAFGPLNLGHSEDGARRLAARALAGVGLSGFEKRITYRLSAGENRLVALAAVLVREPQVLLLDEPANGQNETASESVCRLLAGLPQAMMIVSHQRDLLAPLVQRTPVMAGERRGAARGAG